MKRRDLERRLRVAGCFLKREGGSHSIWMNPKNCSERLYSRASERISRKEEINSSFVASWALTPGTSSIHPIHQSPAFFVIAVNVEPMPIGYPKRHRQQGDLFCVILTADCTDVTDTGR